MKDVIEIAELNDNMIVLEYEVPYNQSRIDCMIFGKDSADNSNIVLIELKQWNDVKAIKMRKVTSLKPTQAEPGGSSPTRPSR